jgi:hypothetical protein
MKNRENPHLLCIENMVITRIDVEVARLRQKSDSVAALTSETTPTEWHAVRDKAIISPSFH